MTTLLTSLQVGRSRHRGDDVYGGTFRILDKVMKPLGIVTTLGRPDRSSRLECARPRPTTKLVWIETPTNPMLKLIDIAADRRDRSQGRASRSSSTTRSRARAAASARARRDARRALHDEVPQRPLRRGRRLHRDERRRVERALRFLQNAIGAIPAPFDCYITLRGLKTLPVRMERHVESAGAIAEWLEAHPQVER
jgi:cystathionine beta-lyase/cystathionine gamma-synthase